MHPCAMLLDEALVLAKLEEKALCDEDVDQADDLAGKRASLIEKAWQERDGYEEGTLRNHLLVVQAMQERLEEMASALHKKLRGMLNSNRSRSKYFSGSRHNLAQSQRSYYFNTVS